MTIALIVVATAFLIVVWAISTIIAVNNQLTTVFEEIRASRSNIVSALQKRLTLVNRLLKITVHFQEYEKETYANIASQVAAAARLFSGRGLSGAVTYISNLGNYYPSLASRAGY